MHNLSVGGRRRGTPDLGRCLLNLYVVASRSGSPLRDLRFGAGSGSKSGVQTRIPARDPAVGSWCGFRIPDSDHILIVSSVQDQDPSMDSTSVFRFLRWIPAFFPDHDFGPDPRPGSGSQIADQDSIRVVSLRTEAPPSPSLPPFVLKRFDLLRGVLFRPRHHHRHRHESSS